MDVYLLAASLFVLPVIIFIIDMFSSQQKNDELQRKDRVSGGGGLGKTSSAGSIQKGSPRDPGLCEVCGIRPRFVERTGVVHPYCGRTCARQNQPTCDYPSCQEPGKSTYSGYCGPAHARGAVEQGYAQPCVECRKQPQAIDDLCLGCKISLKNFTEPRLRELDMEDANAASLVDNFDHLWGDDHPVKIERIYEIRLPPSMAQQREAYYSKIAAVGAPRQIQTFHSAQCICDLGTNTVQFCKWYSCEICTIIRTAFASFAFGVRSNSGQFGPGIYSYVDPSLADRWAVSTTSSPFKVMLACEVNLPSAQAKPRFYGVPKSQEKGPLVFVSKPEAITPKYLILYFRPAPPPPPKDTPTVSNGHGSTQD